MDENKIENSTDINEDIKKENALSSESQEQNFEFITETIKAKPINKRKMLIKFIFTCFLALVFGVIASLTFVVLQHRLQARFYPVDETKTVTLKQEDEDRNEDSISVDDITEAEPEPEPEPEPVVEKEEPAVKPEIVTQIIEKELELDDYNEIYNQIIAIASEASRSMVKVIGVSSESDWFMNIYESNHTTSGLIVADNGKELLILTRKSVISSVDSISITFCDGSKADAVIKRSDANTDLCIVGVDLATISDKTMEAIKMAELGNSKNKSIDGTPVIAIGDPLGVSESMAMGQITSHVSIRDMVDTNAPVLTTDIYGSTNASGVIINYSGKVLGIITQDGSTADTKNLIRCYGISDLRDKIEKISNGQEIAYLGIYGMDVTDEAKEEYGVPEGAYVKQVVIDSPAMDAGIQNGDVIIKLGTTDITSFSDYKDAMLKCQPEDLMMVTVKRLGKNEYVELSYEIKLSKQND